MTTNDSDFRTIAISDIRSSKSNPRKSFDQAKLEELAASIKAKGVLEPVLVRPYKVPAPKVHVSLCKAVSGIVELEGSFELVAGERRWRAAKLAGLLSIPARVVDMTDVEVLEAQVIENEQRDDLSPIEKAEGYQALSKQGQTLEQIAAKVGKSVNAIRGVIKLLRLPEKTREAVTEGHLPSSTAELVARIPNATLREKCAREVLAGRRFGHTNGEPLSYRDTKEHIAREYMTELKQAPFDRKSLDLVPSAGACTACPKCAGNAKEEYPETRADICLDPACFQAKVKAHEAAKLEQARARGARVLPKQEAKALFNEYQKDELRYNSAYIDLASDCHDLPRGSKPWAKVIGDKLQTARVIAVDPQGGVHELVPKAAAVALLKENGVHRRNESPSELRRSDAKRRAEDLVQKEVTRRAMGEIAEAARLAAGRMTGWGPDVVELFRVLLGASIDRAWDDVNRQVKIRRKLQAEKHAHSGGNRDAVRTLIATMKGPELVGLLAELVAGQAFLGFDRDVRKELVDHFGVDPKKIEKQVRADLKKKRKPSRAVRNDA